MYGIASLDPRNSAFQFRTRASVQLLILSALLQLASSAYAAPPDVLTQRYDNGRNGRAIDATLTPSLLAAGNFQKLAELPVYGGVYAQPLFVSNQLIANGTTRDIVIIATATNIIYAFDANDYTQLWTTGALGPPDMSLKAADPSYSCPEMQPMFVSTTGPQTYGIGIQATPVIDRAAGTNGLLYVSYRTNTANNPLNSKQWLAKIDLRTGAVVQTKELTASDLGQPVTALRLRSSLLLTNRVLYLGFGSHCETIAMPGGDEYNSAFLYRGTVLAIDPISLNKVGRFDTMPANLTQPSNGLPLTGGGIWQASSGIASDDAGNLFFTTGNSMIQQTNSVDESSSPSATNVPNSFVRLTPTVTPATGQVTSVTFPGGAPDWFTPYRSEWHNRADMDLGSAGVILPPGTSEVVGGGKEGVIYVLNRSNLGRYSSQHWTPATVHAQGDPFWNPHCITKAPFEDLSQLLNPCDSTCYSADAAGGDAVIQKFTAVRNMDCHTPNMGNWIGWAHIHGTPVFGRAGDGNDYLYMWPEKDYIRAFRRVGGATPYQTAAVAGIAVSPNGGMPGGMLTLSATPTNSSTIVFASVPLEQVTQIDLLSPENTASNVNAGGLIAFDGTPSPNPKGSGTQLKLLWGDFANDEVPYVHAKFVPPTVAKGKVFLATFSNRVNVYGPTSPSPGPTATAITNVAGILQNSTRATALSVDPAGTLAVFGHTNATTGDWPARLATLGSAGLFPASASVALAVHNSNLLVFAVGTDGRLRMFSTPQSGSATTWTGPTIVSSVLMPAGAPIATGRRGTELGVYMVDPAGDVHLFRSATSTPWPDQKLAVASPKFAPGAGIVTDLQGSSQLDVFAVDTAGKVRVYFSSTTPNASWSSVLISGVTLISGAKLATGKRGSNELDVFAIGGTQLNGPLSATCTSSDPNGDTGCLKVMSVVGSFGSWNVATIPREPVLGVYPPGVPGSPIATAKQGADQLNVIFVSQTGAVVIYFSTGTGSWWNVTMSGPYTGSGVNWSTLRAAPGAAITAFPSKLASDGSPSNLDVLVPGNRTRPVGASGIYGSSVVVGGDTWSYPFKAL